MGNIEMKIMSNDVVLVFYSTKSFWKLYFRLKETFLGAYKPIVFFLYIFRSLGN